MNKALELTQRLADELTAHGVMLEYVIAPLIASHPDREEHLARLAEIQRQAEAPGAPRPATFAATLARRLADRVQLHIQHSAAAGPGPAPSG